MLRLGFILLLVLALGSSCEDPIEIDIPDGQERLVVEGWITDQPGPYQIQLSLTNNFNDVAPSPRVSNAQVWVEASDGNSYDFIEQASGVYWSTGKFIGKQGVGYTCFITLEGGEEIVSSTEVLGNVPDLDSLFYKEVFPANIIDGIIQEEFFIGSTIRDPAEVDNYYRWRLTQNSTSLIDVESIVIFSDRFVNGNEFQLEVPQILFARGDTIIVQQEGISEQAFDYYDLLIAQATTLGQSSGTAPAILRGNMSALNNPNEIVLGYFGTASITTDTLFIDPEN